MPRKVLSSIRALLPGALLHLALGALGAGCGSVSTNNDPPPVCTGATCACNEGTACRVSTEVCGASCSLACRPASTCEGACGDSCAVDCAEDARCVITLGHSGSVSCKAGSSCDVSCVSDCSLSCADGAQCRIKCSDAGGFEAVTGGGGC